MSVYYRLEAVDLYQASEGLRSGTWEQLRLEMIRLLFFNVFFLFLEPLVSKGTQNKFFQQQQKRF